MTDSTHPDHSLADDLAIRIAAARRAPDRPLVVGLAAPQGAGKTTLVRALATRLQAQGLATTSLSLDDLYLTRAERLRLAAEVHPLLATRGPPGTHDVALGHAVLDALDAGRPVFLPRFDKALDDRAAPVPADEVRAPVDVVLFEGWCLCASPQSAQDLARPLNALEREDDAEGRWRGFVNDALAKAYPPLFDRIDFLIRLEAPDFATVLAWRLQQEHALAAQLRRTGEPGHAMTDDEVARFLEVFERLTRHMAAGGTRTPDLRIALDAQRRATAPRRAATSG